MCDDSGDEQVVDRPEGSERLLNPLVNPLLRQREPAIRVLGTMPIGYRYTAGVAGEQFFRALADRGAFLATRCPACKVVYCPARAYCERCLAPLSLEGPSLLEAGPEGVLESFTVVRIGMDGSALADPVVVGVIRLRGADTCLVHRLSADPASLRPGIDVVAVLRDPAQRTGCLEDVLHFRLR